MIAVIFNRDMIGKYKMVLSRTGIFRLVFSYNANFDAFCYFGDHIIFMNLSHGWRRTWFPTGTASTVDRPGGDRIAEATAPPGGPVRDDPSLFLRVNIIISLV